MDIQVKTSALVDVLKEIVLGNPSTAFPSAPIISFINDDYAIISNINAWQLRRLDNTKVDWEYQP